MDAANLTGMQRVFSRPQLHAIMENVVRQHPLDGERIRRIFAVYNNFPELKIEDRQHAQG